jgi:threonine dehydrogenase-like Zn-dependent dehydrogenase
MQSLYPRIIHNVKQVFLHGAGDLRIEERELNAEAIAPDQVYVETLVTALSTGTDLGNYLGDSEYVPGAPPYPRAVGYSNVGMVTRVGANVHSLCAGDRVFSMRPNLSAYIAGERDLLVRIPDAVESGEAALIYLAQLGLAAMRQVGYQAGESVAVIGLGVIGLCTVAVARALGAQVTAVANAPSRAETAKQLGAHRAMLAGEELRPESDIVILTANQWDAYRQAVEMARTCGRVSVLGFPGRGQPAPDFNPLDPRWFYAKQLTLVGAGTSARVECAPHELRFNLRRNLELILSLLASGDVSFAPAITHRLPAERMREAFELARMHDKALMGAIFEWRKNNQ